MLPPESVGALEEQDAQSRKTKTGRAYQRGRFPGDECRDPGGGAHGARSRAGGIRHHRRLSGDGRRRERDQTDDLGFRRRHPAARRDGDRHRALRRFPHPRRAAQGRFQPRHLRDRRAGGHRRRREPDRRQPLPAGMDFAPCGSGQGGQDQRGNRQAASVPDDHRAGRIDRQRFLRDRHDDRRRHRPAPHRRGGRRHLFHRHQPPAHVRRRGDGPPLRVSRADERARLRRRLGADPGKPAGRGALGRRDVRGAPGRPDSRPARQHRDRRRGRAPTATANRSTAPTSSRCSRRNWARIAASPSSATSSAAARRAHSTGTSAP